MIHDTIIHRLPETVKYAINHVRGHRPEVRCPLNFRAVSSHMILIASPSLVAHEWCCSACMQRCYQHVFIIILSAHRCIACGTDRVFQHISWRMFALKLTGVLPACFQVNQVKMSFQTIDYESINNWFNNSNECIVFIDYHSMM